MTTATRGRTGPADRTGSGAAGLVLILAAVCMGLMAGLFYAYAISVIPGLARTDDRAFLTSMQRINEAIQNAAFVPGFFGALVFTAAAVVMHQRRGARRVVRWTFAGLALYILALVITLGFNVPLNDKLAAAGDLTKVADAEVASLRQDYESPWVAGNIARGLATTIALGCLGQALLLSDTPDEA